MRTQLKIEAARRNGASFLGLGKQPTHGQFGAPTYRSWASMIQRCTNERRPNFPYYGGRGIKVCDRWREFAAFLEDMGERPDGMTLDRVNNDGDYEPANCRWTGKQQQALNRRPRGTARARPAAQ
jgi:hypothetical protein